MKTKPFDLQAAMNGAKLVTREGREAKFIAYVPEADSHQRIVFLIEGQVVTCYENGHVASIGIHDELDLLIAVPTRSINGYEYPEPERFPLPFETPYWYPAITQESKVYTACWNGGATHTMLLKRGLVHLSKENAKQHAIAEILAGGGEV